MCENHTFSKDFWDTLYLNRPLFPVNPFLFLPPFFHQDHRAAEGVTRNARLLTVAVRPLRQERRRWRETKPQRNYSDASATRTRLRQSGRTGGKNADYFKEMLSRGLAFQLQLPDVVSWQTDPNQLKLTWPEMTRCGRVCIFLQFYPNFLQPFLTKFSLFW